MISMSITAEQLIAEAEELKERVDAMEEEIKKKNGKEHGANEDDPEEDDDEPVSGKKGKGKKVKNANEDEDMKKIKQENAMLTASLKKPIVERVLNASRMAGATEDQIKNQEKHFESMSLQAAEDFAKNFLPAISTSTAPTTIPDLTKLQLGAGLNDTPKSGEELLREAGVY